MPDTKVEGWEDSFNPLMFQDLDPIEGRYFTNVTKLKSYIRSLLSSQAQEIRKECIEVVSKLKLNLDMDSCLTYYGPCDHEGFNEAIDKVIKALEANE